MEPKERSSIRNIARTANYEGRLKFLRLDKNEHLDMVDAKFLREFKDRLTPELVSIYPEIAETRQEVARYVRLPQEHIFLSHGSDAAIKQVFDVFARGGSSVVLLRPTYAMYPIYATMAGANIRWIDCNEWFTVDKSSLLRSIDKNVSIVAIPNPNSPTGSQFQKDFLFECLKKCQRFGVLLLVDEAYFPFSKVTVMDYIDKQDNLVVTRTFSKVFALGGCRAGFMAASSNLIKGIQKARPMYEINSISALAIKISLKNLSRVNRYVKNVEEGKRYLLSECKKLGLIPYPAHTNFINIRLPENLSASTLEDFGRGNGVLFKGKLGRGCFRNCIRITLGPKKYMVRFVELLKNFIQKELNG